MIPAWTFGVVIVVLGKMYKTPPIILNFGKYIIYMSLDTNIKTKTMCSVKIAL